MSEQTQPSHVFPEVANWWDEKLAAERDFREVLEYVKGGDEGGWIGYERYRECIRLAREVLAKHPKES